MTTAALVRVVLPMVWKHMVSWLDKSGPSPRDATRDFMLLLSRLFVARREALGRPQEALQDCRSVLEVEPNHREAHAKVDALQVARLPEGL